MDIRTVTIIGSNGTMGKGISELFFKNGNRKIFLVSRDLIKAIETKNTIVENFSLGASPENLIPKTIRDLDTCIPESDIIIECISEDYQAKSEINSYISNYYKQGTIIATNTSGLSVEELKKALAPNIQENYYGVHFFNPPSSLTLCELVTTSSNKSQTTVELKEFLEIELNREVVVLKDSPAFLANRIGFHFLNEALNLANLYKEEGGIDYIDTIMGKHTGRRLPPNATIDFVGLDIHRAIVDNLRNNITEESELYELPSFFNKLISEGKNGRKAGAGLYKTIKDSSGKKKKLVFDISSGEYRDTSDYKFDFSIKMSDAIAENNINKAFEILKNDKSKEAKICYQLLKSHVDYSIKVTKKIGVGIQDSDKILKYGFNWLPTTSLLALIEKDNNKGLESLSNQDKYYFGH